MIALQMIMVEKYSKYSCVHSQKTKEDPLLDVRVETGRKGAIWG